MKKSQVFWFTGLSGSGKTTLAIKLKEKLEYAEYKVKLIDGDDVREKLHRNLGFTEEDIKKNNDLITQLCLDIFGEYDVILVPIISPYRVSRLAARNKIGESFHEVYISAKIETVVKRDTKGLYRKAMNGEIVNMIGYSPESIYEKPIKSDLKIDTDKMNLVDSIEIFYKFILNQLISRD
jgi:adenylyl-sulfate kinase